MPKTPKDEIGKDLIETSARVDYGQQVTQAFGAQTMTGVARDGGHVRRQ
jgi:hypothetical protein